MFRRILRVRSLHTAIEDGFMDRVAVSKALDEAGRRGATVEEAMSQFRGRINSRFVMYVLYRCNCSDDAAYEFFHWAARQETFRHTTDTYTSMLERFVKSGDIHRALKFFNEELKPNQRPRPIVYTMLIRGVGANHEFSWRAPEYLFHEMRKLGVLPEVNTYNVMFKALCDRGFPGRVLRAFTLMRCRPDIVTYNTVIRGFCMNDRLDWAIFLYQRMTGTEDIDLSDDGVRSVLRASSLFTELPQELVEPDGFTHSSLIHGLCKGRRFEDAVIIFEKMLERKFTPDVTVFNTLVNGLCKGGRFKPALEILKRMVALGYQPDVWTYTTVINGALIKNKIDVAYYLFEQMIGSNCPPNLVTFNSMMSGLSKFRKVKTCMRLLEKMRESGVQPDEYTYNDLMNALVRARRVDDAKLMFQTAMNENLKPDVHMYTTLIKGLSRNRRVDEALIVFEEMKRKCVPNVRAYNLLLQCLCADAKRFGEAFDLYQEMFRVKCNPNRWSFQLMVAGIIKSGQTDKFYEVFMDMVYKGRFAGGGPLIY